ncbi:hypothetical protein SAMN05660226_02971 [Parapedobacter luteus]|uniref:Uncharacterized protein n=1 Tax=Parapedobacter luteus TaxID=623280 RepID=A0A1T5DTA2_9SPHI|nr:hypothetical protein [Parapedobacter luteus]SKB74944.1 hypothetical protein SAMN05660226_02971 [Parapedobacter luteus]
MGGSAGMVEPCVILHILPGMEYRNGDRLLYIGIARNGNGFRELNELMTDVNANGVTLPEVAPAFSGVFIWLFRYRQENSCSTSAKDLLLSDDNIIEW